MDERIINLREYFEKIKKLVRMEVIFSFGAYRCIKKQRIDDILCCIYPTLPESYQKMLKNPKGPQRYKSIFYYKILINKLQREFIFNHQYYVVKEKEISSLVDSVFISISHDMSLIEQRYKENKFH